MTAPDPHADRHTTTLDDARKEQGRNWQRWDHYDVRDERPTRGEADRDAWEPGERR